MKLEQLLIGAAAAAALVITSSAAPTGAISPGGFTSPGAGFQFPAIAQGQQGTTVGPWVLPTGPEDPGLAIGFWSETGPAGPPQFLMTATLEMTPLFPAPLAFITGTMRGELLTFPLTTMPSRMKIFGTWTAQTLTGSGGFHGVVFVRPPPGFPAPALLIGEVQGLFEGGFTIKAAGSHTGTWSLSS